MLVKSLMNFLGHKISAQGIRTDPDKIRSIIEFPTTKDIKGLQGFLRLTGYYIVVFCKIHCIIISLLEFVNKNTKCGGVGNGARNGI